MIGDIETCGLMWLRYTKGCDIIATEASLLGGTFRADIIGCNFNGGYTWEIEVKRSRNDFLQDFVNKAKKHQMYLEGRNGTPNYFYFLGGRRLAKEMKVYMEHNDMPYGVLSVDLESLDNDGIFHTRVTSIRRVKRLHPNETTESTRLTAIRKMADGYCYGQMFDQHIRSGFNIMSQIEECGRDGLYKKDD